MFNFDEFDNIIFDMNTAIRSELSNYANSRAEVLEQTTGRPVFSCTKSTLLTEVQTLNDLLPTTSVNLIANMTYTPVDYRIFLADKLLGVK